MTKDEELEQLRAEKTALWDTLRRKDEELEQSQQANQDLREVILPRFDGVRKRGI